MRRAVSVLVLLWALALGGVTAQAGGDARPSLRVKPATVAPGEKVTLLGANWPRRSAVQLLVGPARSEADPVATVKTDARGRFRKTIQLHRAAVPGRYVFLACLRNCSVKASAAFRILPRLSGGKSVSALATLEG